MALKFIPDLSLLFEVTRCGISNDANGTTPKHDGHSRDPLSLPSGPITRLRAKRFKEALNVLVQQVGEVTYTWRPDKSPKQAQECLVNVIKALEDFP